MRSTLLEDTHQETFVKKYSLGQQKQNVEGKTWPNTILILLANELVRAITKKNGCTKFEKNLSTITISRAQTYRLHLHTLV